MLTDGKAVFVPTQRFSHIKCVLSNVMIIDNSSEDAVTHSLVQLDCRNVIDSDKQVDEPAVVVIANALQRSGQLSSMTSPARRGTDRKTGYMGMPWEVI